MRGDRSVLLCVVFFISGLVIHTEHTPLSTAILHNNLTPSIFTERTDQCGIQHYSRELLMMGIVVPETC